MKRMQHCYNCGEELGVYYKPPHEHDTCGKPECERALRYDEQADLEKQWDEEQDDFGRC